MDMSDWSSDVCSSDLLIEEASTRQSAYDPSVLSLMTPGDISQRILNCRVPIDTLGMHQGLPGPSALAKLAGVTRRVRPDIIIGWMHHAVLAATAAQRMLPSRPPIVWTLRHSQTGTATCREKGCKNV